MKIYCDLDGVLVNFTKGCQKIFPTWTEPMFKGNDCRAHLGITDQEFWETIDKYGEEWWANLEPEPWAEELISVVNFYDRDFIILTSPSLSHFAASGKVLWLQKYFNSKRFKRYIITPAGNKCLLANKESVLIDDNDKNCMEFREHLGYTILFPRSWNENHNKEDQKIEHTKSQLQIIRQYM